MTVGITPHTRSVSVDVKRAVRFAMALEQNAKPVPTSLRTVDPDDFAGLVVRQRLSISLEHHLAALDLPDAAATAIAANARIERLRSLAQAQATVEATQLLTDEGIRVLTIKGVALAMQTTGDLTSRGSGDIDLWVHPTDVTRAARLLARFGYRGYPGLTVSTIGSTAWRYHLWVDYEAPLGRNGAPLDLHWYLTQPRSALPAFDEAWSRREFVNLSSHTVATLGRADALHHSCAHALKDGWRSMRSLIDIDRLARMVPTTERERLIRSRAVRLGTAAALDTTGSPHLADWATTDAREIARVQRTAGSQQLMLHWTEPNQWSASATWQWWRQQMILARTGGDVVRSVAAFVIPPATFAGSAATDDLTMGQGIRQRARFALARVTRH